MPYTKMYKTVRMVTGRAPFVISILAPDFGFSHYVDDSYLSGILQQV